MANQQAAQVVAAEAKPIRRQLHLTDPYEGFIVDPSQVDMHGWGGTHPIFEQIIGQMKPKTIVEVGTWKGASAITMAKALRNTGSDGELICVDTWLGAPEFWMDKTDPSRYLSLKLKNGYPQVYYTFLNNVIAEGLQDFITPFPATSFVAQRWFVQNNLTADLIYVDAAHEYQEVIADIAGWFKVLRPGGVMIGDDYSTYWPGVIRAVEEMFDKDASFRKFGIFNEKWVAQKIV